MMVSDIEDRMTARELMEWGEYLAARSRAEERAHRKATAGHAKRR